MPRRMFSTVPFPSGAFSRSIWEKLYERAILELDYAKVPERIAEARHAMHDRAEEILTESSIGVSLDVFTLSTEIAPDPKKAAICCQPNRA